MPITIRAFVALPLPPIVKTELAQISRLWAEKLPPRMVRWVLPENMHLTLHFLGETAVAQLPALASELDQLAASTAPFQLQLGQLGCFPNKQRPRVLWVGLGGNLAALAALKQQLDQRLRQLGWRMDEKPFQAHLTLGRLHTPGQWQWEALQIPVQAIPFAATQIQLIESRLERSGPLYTVRQTAVFAQLPKP